MTYNLTWINQTNTVLDLASGVNTLSDGWLFPLITMFLFMVFAIGFKRYKTSIGIIVASIICMMITELFWMAGLVTQKTIIIYLITLLIGGLMKSFSDN